MPEHAQVLIVGAGPVGLSTALFLARRGIRPVVIERRSGLSSIPRATGLHARTMELFRTAGLEDAIRDAGLKIVGPGQETELVKAGRATPLVMLGAQSLATLDRAFVLESHDVPYADFTPSWPIWCGQDYYEPLIHDAAVAAGADIRFGAELTGLTQDDDGVTATLAGGETIRADYLVGADGVKSAVRDTVGIGTRSHGSAGHFVSIIFRAKIELPDDAPRFTLVYLMNPAAQGLLLFIEPGRWMFGVNYYPERGQSPADFTREKCVEYARIAAGDPALDVDVESFTPWDATHMVADGYRAGRVFLAGDAAHAHPPAGGFGVNAGVQDAHNLAWKLAAVLRGEAGPALLDSYQAERHPIGAATADQAWMLFRSRGRLAEEDRDKARDFVVVTMGYRYRSDAVIGAPADAETLPRALSFTGAPGSRAPHGWVSPGVSTIDLFTDEFTLVVTESVDLPGGVLADLPVKVRTDLPEEWLAAAGVGPGGALLVRPDGIVAWRATGPFPPGELADAYRRILDR